MTVVATTTWLAEHNGSQFEIVVEIGTPYRYGPDEWACPVALRGLHEKLSDMRGSDSVQALCLAARLAFTLLSAFKNEGGKILHSDGSEVSLESYISGAN